MLQDQFPGDGKRQDLHDGVQCLMQQDSDQLDTDDNVNDILEEGDQAFGAEVCQHAKLLRDRQERDNDRDDDRQRNKELEILQKLIYKVFAGHQDLFGRAFVLQCWPPCIKGISKLY